MPRGEVHWVDAGASPEGASVPREAVWASLGEQCGAMEGFKLAVTQTGFIS